MVNTREIDKKPGVFLTLSCGQLPRGSKGLCSDAGRFHTPQELFGISESFSAYLPTACGCLAFPVRVRRRGRVLAELVAERLEALFARHPCEPATRGVWVQRPGCEARSHAVWKAAILALITDG